MKKLLLTAILVTMATPSLAKEYAIREISDPAGEKPYYFEPDHLVIQPGDTVTFVNGQDDTHDVMFVVMPKSVDETIMSPMFEKEGEKWSYTFNTPGTYEFHCHPHEGAGMKGTLIVGEASKPEETKSVDHEAMENQMGSMPGMDMNHMEHMEHGGMNHMDMKSMPMGDGHSMMGAHSGPLTKIEPQYVCMMNNAAFDKPQIPVDVGGKTYYGCCPMCKSMLENDAAARQAVDPVSGKTVDKAGSVIGKAEDGKVYYFENEDNMRQFGGGNSAESHDHNHQ